MEDLRKIEIFLQTHVSDKDLQYIGRQLKNLKKTQDGGSRNRKKKYRRHMRGGTKHQKQIYACVLIMIVCLSMLGTFNHQCQTVGETTARATFLKASKTEWLYWCDQWLVFTQDPYDYIWKFRSVYGHLMDHKQVREILDFAKQQIVALALNGTGYTAGIGTAGLAGIGVAAKMLRNKPEQSNKKKTRTAFHKYRLLEDKILSPIRPPRKKWDTFDKIANPETGRLLSISREKGKFFLQCYLQQQTSNKCKKIPNVCDPKSGVWMDVNTKDGVAIIEQYKNQLQNHRPE